MQAFASRRHFLAALGGAVTSSFLLGLSVRRRTVTAVARPLQAFDHHR
jgi:hypothetical protein